MCQAPSDVSHHLSFPHRAADDIREFEEVMSMCPKALLADDSASGLKGRRNAYLDTFSNNQEKYVMLGLVSFEKMGRFPKNKGRLSCSIYFIINVSIVRMCI